MRRNAETWDYRGLESGLRIAQLSHEVRDLNLRVSHSVLQFLKRLGGVNPATDLLDKVVVETWVLLERRNECCRIAEVVPESGLLPDIIVRSDLAARTESSGTRVAPAAEVLADVVIVGFHDSALKKRLLNKAEGAAATVGRCCIFAEGQHNLVSQLT